MIYIFTALLCEAKPLISFFNLKKQKNIIVWEQYTDEEQGITLSITGTGPIAAASCVSAVLSSMDRQNENFVLNIGTCCKPGVKKDFGKMYLINKLTDSETGRDYYPDIYNCCGIPESGLISAARPAGLFTADKELDGIENNNKILYDMEGAFVYQTVRYYLGPSGISFLKLVSDGGFDPEDFSFNEFSSRTEAIFSENKDVIIEYVEAFRQKSRTISEEKGRLLDRDKEACDYDRTVADLHATAAMENRLRQLIRYSSCAGIKFEDIINKMYIEGELPSKNKKGGLDVLAKISDQVLSTSQ